MRHTSISKIAQIMLRTTCFGVLCLSVPTFAFADDGLGLRGEITETKALPQALMRQGVDDGGDFTFHAMRGLHAEPLLVRRSPLLRLFTHDHDWKQIDHEFKMRLDPMHVSAIPAEDTLDNDNLTGLRGAVQASLANSYDLRIALKSAEVSNTNIWSAIASFTPTLSASYSHSLSQAGDALERSEGSAASLTLAVPIFTGGTRMFNMAVAKNSALSSHYSALATMDQVQLQTVQTYIQLVSAQQTLDIYRKGLKQAKTLFNATQARQSSGFASMADVSLVRANLAAAQRNVEQGKGDLRQAKIALKSRTGQNVQPVAHDLNLHKHLNGGLEALITSARSHNPSLRAANANYRAQLNSTRASYGQFLPQVNLQAKYDYYPDKAYNGDRANTDGWSAGIQVSIPLVNLASVAETSIQRQQTDIAILSEAQALHSVETDLKGLWSNYRSLNGIVAEAEKEKKARQHVFASIRGQYKEGFTTLESLVDADQNAQNAALTALQLKSQRDIVAAQLLTIAGQFKPSMLRK